MLSKFELERLVHVLEEAQRSDTGDHWAPERYADDLRASLCSVKHELRAQAVKEFIALPAKASAT